MSAETLTLETSPRLSSFVPLRSHFLDHHNADTIHLVFLLGGGGRRCCALLCACETERRWEEKNCQITRITTQCDTPAQKKTKITDRGRNLWGSQTERPAVTHQSTPPGSKRTNLSKLTPPPPKFPRPQRWRPQHSLRSLLPADSKILFSPALH